MNENVEPWLRGNLTEIDAVKRQVLHALELTREDIDKWCTGLSNDELNARPHGLAPVAFHLRHIARSLDRLLTYAEGKQLSGSQMAALKTELAADALSEQVLTELHTALASATDRIRSISPSSYEEIRGVGRAMLLSTVGGLLVHCAEHTQRHSGQAIITAKLIIATRA